MKKNNVISALVVIFFLLSSSLFATELNHAKTYGDSNPVYKTLTYSVNNVSSISCEIDCWAYKCTSTGDVDIYVRDMYNMDYSWVVVGACTAQSSGSSTDIESSVGNFTAMPYEFIEEIKIQAMVSPMYDGSGGAEITATW